MVFVCVVLPDGNLPCMFRADLTYLCISEDAMDKDAHDRAAARARIDAGVSTLSDYMGRISPLIMPSMLNVRLCIVILTAV